MSIIINDKIEEYIYSLCKPENEFLSELRKDAESRDIPILTIDTERLMTVLLKMHRPKRILEIGTAVGYSAIHFASILDSVEIVSLEVSEKMVEEALKNIKRAGLSERINVLFGDAGETLNSLESQFDMIFIDAAKGQYKLFFDLCQKFMSAGSVIVSDNVLYKGMTASNDFLIKRKRTIVKRMRDYLKYITECDKVDTVVLTVGDGVAVSIVK